MLGRRGPLIGTAVVALAATAYVHFRGDSAREAPSPERGKLIYTRGVSGSGDPLTVTVDLFGGSGRTMSATRYACINCHGAEGQPGLEGGVPVPGIQPHQLASPTPADNATGRVRAAYDAAKLRRAITIGVDASGNPLNMLMPRFDVSDRDLSDLIAYLGRLGSDDVPGVGRDEIRAVSILDPDACGPEVAAAVRETLTAFADETNRVGGVYGRALRLDVLSTREWNVLLRDADPTADYLCVVAPFAPDPALPEELPVLGVLEPDPPPDPAPRENLFYLYPSQITQLRVAIDHYCEVLQHRTASFRLLLSGREDPQPFRLALDDQVSRYPGSRATCEPFDASAEREAVDVVLLAGEPAHKLRVLRALGGREDVAAIYSTHPFPQGAATRLDRGALDKLRLLLPIPIPEAGEPRLAVFRQFLARHQLAETQVPHRIAAFAAGAAFVECLKRCGKRVTRDKLTREVRSLYRFQPGLFAPVTYNANRNVGARGAQVARYDPEQRALVPLADWSEPR